jgi:hypothetical protein
VAQAGRARRIGRKLTVDRITRPIRNPDSATSTGKNTKLKAADLIRVFFSGEREGLRWY